MDELLNIALFGCFRPKEKTRGKTISKEGYEKMIRMHTKFGARALTLKSIC